MIASKSTNENSEYLIALHLSVIGDRALKIYNNFTYSESEDENNVKTVMNKFDHYFTFFFLREQKDERINS